MHKLQNAGAINLDSAFKKQDVSLKSNGGANIQRSPQSNILGTFHSLC